MKKVLTLFAAVVLFATAAMAETLTATGSVYAEVKSSSYNLTQYQLTTDLGMFYFTFAGTTGVTIGTTYDYDQMDADYSYFNDGSNYYAFTAATFTRTAVRNFTATATCEDGNIYNITIAPLDPITEFLDTVNIDFVRAECKLTDAVASSNVFQLVANNSNYGFYFAIQNATAIAGTYTDDNVLSTYTALYSYAAGDTTMIEFNNLNSNLVVTGDATTGVNATIEYVGTDSVLYVITYTYSDPTPTTEVAFNATDLVVAKNAYFDLYELYYGVYVYDFYATQDGEMVYGTTYNEEEDSYDGQWTYDGGYTLDLYILDAATYEEKYEIFSAQANLATAVGGNTVTLTGNALVYGDIQYNFNCSGSYVESAVENVETSKYAVLSQKNGVDVVGAEGEVVALYDMAGRMIQSIKANSDMVHINVAVPGVYVIKVNGESMRAIVK